jgi:ribonuclease HII
MNRAYENRKLKSGFDFVVGCDEVGRGCLAGPVVAAAVVFSKEINMKDLRGVNDSKVLSAQQRDECDVLIKQSALGWGIGVVSEKVIDKINIHQASLLAMRRAVEDLLGRFSSKMLTVIPTDRMHLPFDWAQGTLSVAEWVRERRDPSAPVGMTQGTKGLPRQSPIRSDSGRLELAETADALLPRNDRWRDKNILVVVDGKFIIPKFDMQQEAVVDGDAKILSIAAASIIAKVYRDNLMVRLHKKFPEYNFIQHKGYATLHHREAIKKFGLTPIHRLSFCSQYR